MGASLEKVSPEQVNDAMALCNMRAMTGCGYRYDVKKRIVWHVKRVASGDCTLCSDIETPCTWREVSVCGHRFHRSCLRDHRRDHGAICPTCDASYTELIERKILVETGERIDPSLSVTVG